MTTAINNAGWNPPLLPTRLDAADSQTAPKVSFQQALTDSLGQIHKLETDAQLAVQSSLAGGELTMAESLTAVKKADLALRLMVQMRNKVVEAYQEIQQLRM